MTISRTLTTAAAATALVGAIGLVYAQSSDERTPQNGTTDMQTMPSQDNTTPMTTTSPQNTTNNNSTTTPDSSTTNNSSTYPSNNSSTMPSDNSYNSSTGTTTDERAPRADRN